MQRLGALQLWIVMALAAIAAIITTPGIKADIAMAVSGPALASAIADVGRMMIASELCGNSKQ
jgi:hypothetical protein